MERLAISLYTDSVRFQRTEDIPHAVRHRIVQHAMRERDLELAAAMARDLTTTHAEQSADEWTLVRARLAIYSGDVSAGEVLLERLIISKEALDKNMSDRVLQLVFDLQGVDRHAQALHLFRLIQQRAQSEIIQREIHFWIGESLESLGEHERAAESFIRSSLHGGNHRDVWGQTSRFHAAEALADAGLIEDARAVYRGLLDEVTDRGQMIALDKKLQDLWMRDQGREGSQIENIE
jgi:tetratricopeptide (TPR) repeat protein